MGSKRGAGDRRNRHLYGKGPIQEGESESAAGGSLICGRPATCVRNPLPLGGQVLKGLGKWYRDR